MNQPQPSPAKPGSSTPRDAGDSGKRPKRFRWRRWLLGLLALIAAIGFFLPNLAALPMFRGRLMQWLFSRWNMHVTADELSLGWFSPVTAGEVKILPENTDRAAVTMLRFEGNTSLWNLIFGRQWGTFRVQQGELHVEFDQDGSNIGRLLRGIAGSSLGNRPGKIEIVDGRISLRGQNSAQPWQTGGLNLDVDIVPGGENPSGVTVLAGGKTRLLHEVELTPEMCDDIFKYVIPLVAQTTRTSGRVSLQLDEFHWPLGKPDQVKLQGQFTLHSVEVAPGPLVQSLGGLIELPASLTGNVQIAKDDVVAFSMHDGRVYHENLTFALTMFQPELTVVSHGSVGLNETLDWYIDIELQKNAALAESPLANLLNQRGLTLHNTGTLSQWSWSPEGISLSSLKSAWGLLQIWRQRRNEQPRPGLLRGGRRDENPLRPPAGNRFQEYDPR